MSRHTSTARRRVRPSESVESIDPTRPRSIRPTRAVERRDSADRPAEKELACPLPTAAARSFLRAEPGVSLAAPTSGPLQDADEVVVPAILSPFDGIHAIALLEQGIGPGR